MSEPRIEGYTLEVRLSDGSKKVVTGSGMPRDKFLEYTKTAMANMAEVLNGYPNREG